MNNDSAIVDFLVASGVQWPPTAIFSDAANSWNQICRLQWMNGLLYWNMREFRAASRLY